MKQNKHFDAIATLAFFPITGILGIHNFVMKQYVRGVCRVILVIIDFLISLSYNFSFTESNMALGNISMILDLLLIVSYALAIPEGINVLQLKKQQALSNIQIANNQVTTNQVVESQDVTFSQTTTPTTLNVDGDIAKSGQGQVNDRKMWSIVSIIATILPILVLTYCFVESHGGFSDNDGGAVWWLAGMYYMPIGIIAAVIAIYFGIVGLKTSLRWLSIVSLVIKALMIVGIVSFACWAIFSR